MKVLVVSGIWPPDVGGPASHAPDVARFLTDRGHDVEALITAASAPALEPFRVHRVSRALPKGALHLVAGAGIARAARRADVVYATGLFARTAAACAVARRPYVVKLTGDPAFERARWRRTVTGDVRAFQQGGGGIEGAFLRVVRDQTVGRAAHVVCPSGFLRELAVSWGIAPSRVSVLPNPAPALPPLPPRDELRRSFGIDGPTLVFAGRFGPQKALDVLVEAVGRVDGVTLVLAGEGDAPAAGERVRFVGALPRERVLELFAAADASVLSSSWENFPHSLVEALAVGAPVIATRVGGVPEIVEDGVNGLLVPAGDVGALAGAIRRFFSDDALRARLRAAAAPSVARLSPDEVMDVLERTLERVVRLSR
jgi:glycosyltransferase involved in cell wall biosynthesis